MDERPQERKRLQWYNFPLEGGDYQDLCFLESGDYQDL
jgi:hypothetical protein